MSLAMLASYARSLRQRSLDRSTGISLHRPGATGPDALRTQEPSSVVLASPSRVRFCAVRIDIDAVRSPVEEALPSGQRSVPGIRREWVPNTKRSLQKLHAAA